MKICNRISLKNDSFHEILGAIAFIGGVVIGCIISKRDGSPLIQFTPEMTTQEGIKALGAFAGVGVMMMALKTAVNAGADLQRIQSKHRPGNLGDKASIFAWRDVKLIGALGFTGIGFSLVASSYVAQLVTLMASLVLFVLVVFAYCVLKKVYEAKLKESSTVRVEISQEGDQLPIQNIVDSINQKIDITKKPIISMKIVADDPEYLVIETQSSEWDFS